MKKTITFACMHFTVAFTVAYLLTGSALVGGVIALVEPAINTLVFYFHERVWNQFESQPESQTVSGASSHAEPSFESNNIAFTS